jgi:hypothetical protein
MAAPTTWAIRSRTGVADDAHDRAGDQGGPGHRVGDLAQRERVVGHLGGLVPVGGGQSERQYAVADRT